MTTAIPGNVLIEGSPVGAALPTIAQTSRCCPEACSYLLSLSGTKVWVQGCQLMFCGGTLQSWETGLFYGLVAGIISWLLSDSTAHRGVVVLARNVRHCLALWSLQVKMMGAKIQPLGQVHSPKNGATRDLSHCLVFLWSDDRISDLAGKMVVVCKVSSRWMIVG